MSEKIFVKAPVDVELNIDTMLLVADKVADLLDSDIEEPLQRYFVARLISILYEETWNFCLDPEFETKIRRFAKKSPKDVTGD